MNYIWIKNKRYYYYDTYDTWQQAYQEAKHLMRKNPKNRYFILKTETWMFPQNIYKLYMTRTMRLGLI